MLVLILSLTLGGAVALAVFALMATPANRSVHSRRVTTIDLAAGNVDNAVVRRIMQNDRVRSIATSDATVAPLMAELGEQETVQEFYAWRYYNAGLLGGVVGLSLLLASVFGFLIAGATVGFVMVALAIVLGFGTGALTYYTKGAGSLRTRKAKRALRVNRNMYQLLERVASSLNDGRPPREAIIGAAPYVIDPDVKQQIDLVVADFNSNVPFDRALGTMKDRCAISTKGNVFPVVDSFVDALCAANRDGSNPSKDFIDMATELRSQKAQVIKERTDKAVMVIGSVGIVGFAPLIVAALMWGMIYGQLVEMGIL